MIQKRGSAYELRSKSTGKLLGRHRSKADAVAQERAIRIVKHYRGVK